ncbi:porin family protein [Flavobacterium sp.]|uniref:porin family protein n=1 Tax=Flavobacterium sp. TaxID=239 RepID=UPI00120B8D4B|nr:porin family protein [Flavobacterium sp.]RZJ72845.1 MAG: PorT family protein [Flavobacterium sp.]
MNKLFALALLLPLVTIAQIRFQKGYFIDNGGKKVECLIRNKGWNNNPTSFDYKISETSETQQGTLKDVREFSLEDGPTYTKATVAMERSTEKVQNMQMQRDAKFTLVEETHFLRLLFQASHSLYILEDSGIFKFFDRDRNGVFTQLVHIAYVDSQSNLRHYNQYYSQLLANFSCEGSTLESMSKLKYSISELTEYYRKTSECKGEKVTEVKKSKGDFNLRPFLGFKSMKLDASAYSGNPGVSITKSGLAYGMEFEYILPTNKKKWAILIDMEYNKLEGDIDFPDGSSINDLRAKINFSSLQIPIGGRYYAFLSDDFKFFANATINLNFISDKSEIVYGEGVSQFSKRKMDSNSYNFGIGAGVSYKRLNAEIRYYTNQELYRTTDGNVSKFALLVSYAIF